jgi:hypothetical protein
MPPLAMQLLLAAGNPWAGLETRVEEACVIAEAAARGEAADMPVVEVADTPVAEVADTPVAGAAGIDSRYTLLKRGACVSIAGKVILTRVDK